MSLANLFNDLHDEGKTPAPQTDIPDIGKVIRRFWKKHPDRADGAPSKIRASGAYWLCPREFVLQYWQPKNRSKIEIANKLMMNVGTTIHDVLQNQILGPTLCIRGWWKNMETGEKKEGFHPDPEHDIWNMANGKPLTWNYREPSYWHGVWRISGHSDGIISLPRLNHLDKRLNSRKVTWLELLDEIRQIDVGNEALLEMKSAGSWAANKQASGGGLSESYQCQASIYQWLSGVHRTLFLYIDRDTMKFLPSVDYQIDWGWVNTVKRKARIIWESIRDETLPDAAMVCSTPNDSRAKQCPHAKDCFAHLRTSAAVTPANFSAYVAQGKARAAKEGRNLLDLSKWETPA